jgi:poly(3-hydroxyoctanoate) depolymerase
MWFIWYFLAFFQPAQAKTCFDHFRIGNDVKINVTVEYFDREVQIFKPQDFSSKKKYPVLLYFHGTGSVVDLSRPIDAKYGLYHESRFIREITDAGYVVLAPTANSLLQFMVLGGVLAWEANISPYSSNFQNSRDYALVKILLSELPELIGAKVNSKKIFVGGFSSGGYMSSRIANEAEFASMIAGVFIHSASYGKCLQGNCAIPQILPENHPKTLLIANFDDPIVPFNTIQMYQQTLKANKISVDTLFSEAGDHAWLSTHSPQILSWLASGTVK